ncbi:MAG TPA: hypothetical protein VLE45_01160 [Burkholderiaceae bacterium]|nr:hypothetical protein [Burkholderiaceae bacterium]
MTVPASKTARPRHTVGAGCAASTAAILVLGIAPLAQAADAPGKPQSPAARKQQLESRAKGLALGQETAQRINEAQLQIADRVLTGDAACEFDQTVSVLPIDGRPGHFRLIYKKVAYTVIPEETSTGAIRLEDKKAGIVWLQIPSKSMLMNARAGQRMVDGCMHAEQRAAVSAVRAASAAAGGKP